MAKAMDMTLMEVRPRNCFQVFNLVQLARECLEIDMFRIEHIYQMTKVSEGTQMENVPQEFL